jgi:hypothetical protein
MQLEFGLHVHFAIWPLLPTSPPTDPAQCADRLTDFKSYLETRGARLTSNQGFLCYYALPYVDPAGLQSHPSFTHLFAPECTAQARCHLPGRACTVLLCLRPACNRACVCVLVLRPHKHVPHALLDTTWCVLASAQMVLSCVQQRMRLETYLRSIPGEVHVPTLYSLYNAAQQIGGANVPPAPPGLAVSDSDVAGLLDGSRELATLVPRDASSDGQHSRSLQQSPEPQGGSADDSPVFADQAAGPSVDLSWEGADQRFHDVNSQLAAIPEASQEAIGRSQDAPASEHTGVGLPELLSASSSGAGSVAGSAAGSQAMRKHSAAQADQQAAPADDIEVDKNECPLPTKAVSPEGKQSAAAASSDADSARSAEVAATWGAASSAVQASTNQRGSGWGTGAGDKGASVTRSVVEQALLPAVDWGAVRGALLERPPADAARLLQAVRWRLIKSPPGAYRRQVLADLAAADVLSCGSGVATGAAAPLLELHDDGVSSELVRLLSALASDSAGRAHLLQPGSGIVASLFGLLQATPERKIRRRTGALAIVLCLACDAFDCDTTRGLPLLWPWLHAPVNDTQLMTGHALLGADETRDTPIHQHTLAALQKLSLCRGAQSALAAVGVLPWLVQFLGTPDTLSEHCLEYAMALLMNVCLRTVGRAACERLPVLDVLDAYIQARSTHPFQVCGGLLSASVSGRLLGTATQG